MTGAGDLVGGGRGAVATLVRRPSTLVGRVHTRLGPPTVVVVATAAAAWDPGFA